MTPFSRVLKDMRQSLGLSQSALALQLGSTQRHLSFLETGRSQPTRSFLARLCRELKLSVAQRANLYAASGLPNPYPLRAPDAPEIAEALDLMERRVLAHWPFPGLVLDAAWNVIRSNAIFDRMLGPMMQPAGNRPNLYATFLSPGFRSLVVNWEDALEMLFFRLQAGAADHAEIAAIYARAKADGLFDPVQQRLMTGGTERILVPIRLRPPEGPELQIMSLIGKLAVIHDALVDGFEIELMLPADDVTEAVMLRG